MARPDDEIKDPRRRQLLMAAGAVVALPLIASCSRENKPSDLIQAPQGTSINIPRLRIKFHVATSESSGLSVSYSPSGIEQLSQIIPDSTSVELSLFALNGLDPLNRESVIPSSRLVKFPGSRNCEAYGSLVYGEGLIEARDRVSRIEAFVSNRSILREWNNIMREMVYTKVGVLLNYGEIDNCDRSTRAGVEAVISDLDKRIHPFWFDSARSYHIQNTPFYEARDRSIERTLAKEKIETPTPKAR